MNQGNSEKHRGDGHGPRDLYCSRCGALLTGRIEGGRERQACASCGHIIFGEFTVGVGGLLRHDGRVLLIQRAHEPGKGRWTLPGGYCEEDEPPHVAVVREVMEETGLAVTATGILAIRHAQTHLHQNAYYVFGLKLECRVDLLKVNGDGDEVGRCVFVEPGCVDELGDVGMISKWAIELYGVNDTGLMPVPPGSQPTPVPSHVWTEIYAAVPCGRGRCGD